MRNYTFVQHVILCIGLVFVFNFCFAQSYQPAHETSEFENRMPQESDEVGTIIGTASVGATGGALYSIPIEVAPGTNGMIPHLSFDYNSQSGNDLLGWGWSIGGLSAIVRTGRSIFHDDITAAIEFSVNDRFALDGQRLMLTSGTYGSTGSEYDTEAASFSTISLSSVGGSNETFYYFKMLTKEGMILEYGLDWDSKVLSTNGNQVLAWRLSRMIDPFGNYVEYKYSGNGQDSWLEEVRYMGNINTGSSPAGKLIFTYEDRIDASKRFVPGAAVSMTKLLRQVNVFTDDNMLVRSYSLTYSWRDDRGSFLNEIVLSGADGIKRFNATQFAYGAVGSSISESIVNLNYAASPMDIIVGDFDGNGVSDKGLVEVGYEEGVRYHKRITVFLNNESTATYTTQLSGFNIVDVHNGRTNGFVTTDINGDGRDDIVISKVIFEYGINPIDNETGQWSNPDLGVWRFLGLNILISECNFGIANFTSHDYTAPTSLNAFKQPRNFMQIGDFDGDGRTDIVVILNHISFLQNAEAFIFTNSIWSQVILSQQVRSSLANARSILTSDFNGDGRSELMSLDRGYINDIPYLRALSLTQNLEFTSIYSGIFDYEYADPITQERSYDIYSGDFNGDRITDYLVRRRDGAADDGNDPDWYILTGIANVVGQIGNAGYLAKRFYFANNVEDSDQLIIGDFDGNGLSDIYHRYSFDNTHYVQHYFSFGHDGAEPLFYVSNGEGTINNYSQLGLGDFNGDGRLDVIGWTDNINGPMVSMVNSGGHERLLHGLSNGLMARTIFEFKSSTEFGLNFSSCVYPLSGSVIPIDVVQNSASSNGIGSMNDYEHSYFFPRYHRTGRGFLGFLTNTVKETTTGLMKIADREIDLTYFMPNPIENSNFDQGLGIYLERSVMVNHFEAIGIVGEGRFLLQQLVTEVTNSITGATNRTTNAYDNYGNIVSSVTDLNNGLSITERQTEYAVVAPGQIPNKVQLSRVISTRDGSPSVDQDTYFTYAPQTGAVENIFDYYGTAKQTITELRYNVYGSLVKRSRTFDGLAQDDQRVTEFEYDDRSRFVVRKKTWWNESGTLFPLIEEFSYDSRLGVLLSSLSTDGLTKLHSYDTFGREETFAVPHVAGNPRDVIVTSRTWALDLSTQQYYKYQVNCPGKPSVEEFFDQLGRKIRSGQEINAQNEWSMSSLTFDYRGNVVSETEPHILGEDHWVLTHTFDNWNRKTFEVNSLTGQQNYTYEYDGSGSTTSTIVAADGSTKISVMDASGKQVSVIDEGGKLVHVYDSWGNLTRVLRDGSFIATMNFDEYGRKANSWNPHTRTTQYEYDAFGQLVREEDLENNITTYKYDNLGRIIERNEPEGITRWTYFRVGNKANNNVMNINGLGVEYSYDYTDPYNRLVKKSKLVDGVTYSTEYVYDVHDNLSRLKFPSGIKVDYSYTSVGNIDRVEYQGRSLFENGRLNGQGKYVEYNMGSLPMTRKRYTAGLPTSYSTVGFQNLAMKWNLEDGNLVSRWNKLNLRIELFNYDELDRLLDTEVKEVDIYGNIIGDLEHTRFSYDGEMGNTHGDLIQMDDVGKFSYNRNMVVGAFNGAYPMPANLPPDVINIGSQDIQYTTYHQAKYLRETIGQDTHTLNYGYGPDHQRSLSERSINGQLAERRIYVDKYEKSTTSSDHVTREVHYVSGGDGTCALLVTENGITSVHHVFMDHLGSIVRTIESVGFTSVITSDQNFDAWGRRRNATNWTYEDIESRPLWLYRGFTGHEHLDDFSLINMNGRIYDPVVGRMLSADKFLQGGSQGFNGYSYALNNPLKFTDPTGQTVWLPFSGPMGGNQNYTRNLFFDTGGMEWAIMAIRITASAILGASVASLTPNIINGGGAIGGLVNGAARGFSSSFVVGFFNNQDASGRYFEADFKAALEAGKWGALGGGVAGAIKGGLNAAATNRSIFTGNYKKYNYMSNDFASLNDDVQQSVFGEDYGLFNMDDSDVFYKPEEGQAGLNNKLKSGKWMKETVDGVATSRYGNMVFKIPDGVSAVVEPGGGVQLQFSMWDEQMLNLKYYQNPNYQYGWMSYEQLDINWLSLFMLAR